MPSTATVAVEVHASRLLTTIPFPVGDLLKPAYSFGGLPLVQLGKPYVDNWLNVRQSTADIAQAYSIFVLATDLSATLAGGAGEDIEKRVKLFNKNRSNKGTMVIDKDHEDFKNISANIAGIEAVQAASQEHMSAAWRIPLVKLTGISPSGLNASSEGEIRVYYDLEKEGAKGANDACRRAQRSPCLRQQPRCRCCFPSWRARARAGRLGVTRATSTRRCTTHRHLDNSWTKPKGPLGKPGPSWPCRGRATGAEVNRRSGPGNGGCVRPSFKACLRSSAVGSQAVDRSSVWSLRSSFHPGASREGRAKEGGWRAKGDTWCYGQCEPVHQDHRPGDNGADKNPAGTGMAAEPG